MHILSGKSKSIDMSTSREGGDSFLISSFFLSTYFKVSCISLQKNSDRRDVLGLRHLRRRRASESVLVKESETTIHR